MSTPFSKPLTIKQQIEFTERLTYLLNAGVSLLEGLNLIEMQTQSKRFKKAIQNIVKRIGDGESFSGTLHKLRVLDDFSICAIDIGETTGTLSDNLSLIAEQLRKREGLRRKLAVSMTYPAIVLIAAMSLSLFLTYFIFPKIRPLFDSLHVALPFSTRLLITISSISPYTAGTLIGLGIISCLVLIIAYKKSIVVRWYAEKLITNMPVIGGLRRNSALVDLFRMLGILVKSGTGLQASFVTLSRTAMNLIYKNECIETAERLGHGEQLSEILMRQPRLFPAAATGFLAIGESTGNVSEICFHIAAMIENDIDGTIKKMSSLVEPLLMLIMGTMVGFVALAIITPLYAITQNIK